MCKVTIIKTISPNLFYAITLIKVKKKVKNYIDDLLNVKEYTKLNKDNLTRPEYLIRRSWGELTRYWISFNKLKRF